MYFIYTDSSTDFMDLRAGGCHTGCERYYGFTFYAPTRIFRRSSRGARNIKSRSCARRSTGYLYRLPRTDVPQHTRHLDGKILTV